MTNLSRPLRVVHVTDSLGQGGAEQNLLTVLRRLPPDRFEHHIIWLFERDELVPAFEPLTRSLHALHCRGPWALPLAVPVLARLIREIRPDVVHTQLLCAQIAARFATRCTRIPTGVVTTWQSTYYDTQALAE